jgi:hypothetical protein
MRRIAIFTFLLLSGCGSAHQGLTTGTSGGLASLLPGKVDSAPLAPVAAPKPSPAIAAMAPSTWHTATRDLPGGLQAGATLQRVAVTTAGYPTAKAAEDAAVVKAAELTRSLGATHFIVVRGGEEEASFGLPFSSAREYVLYLRILKQEGDEPVPTGSASAEEVLTFMGKAPPKAAGTAEPAPRKG